ncbi:MAG TPA: hypothetical protein VFB19_08825 [Mycobacterium sp.]|nr:hypothetical protein [Mycobacterium sp.]
MATIGLTARRTAFGLAVALALFGGLSAVAPRVVADPGDCTTSSEPGDNSLACTPDQLPGLGDIGAPSETDLTNSNPGVNSPHGHR